MRHTEEASYGATEDQSFAHKVARTAGGEQRICFRFHQICRENVKQEFWRLRSAFHALVGGMPGPGVAYVEHKYCVGATSWARCFECFRRRMTNVEVWREYTVVLLSFVCAALSLPSIIA